MKLSDLTSATKVVTLEYAGNSIDLTVRTAVITTRFITEMAKFDVPATGAAAVAAQLSEVPAILCRLVAAWDVIGDDGKPFPLEPERVAETIPLEFMTAVIRAATATSTAGEAAAPGPTVTTNGGDSGAISSTLN